MNTRNKSNMNSTRPRNQRHSEEVEQWLPGHEHDRADYDVPISGNSHRTMPLNRLRCHVHTDVRAGV
jgi:hypothetical protein